MGKNDRIRKATRSSYVSLMLSLMTGAALASGTPQPTDERAISSNVPPVRYGMLPLSFEANHGQSAEPVRYLAHGPGYNLFLTANGAVLDLQGPGAGSQKPEAGRQRSEIKGARDSVLWMRLIGANPSAAITGVEELPSKSNYFIGNDPKNWRTDIPNYAEVKYTEIYSGVDMVFYGRQGQLEFDFVLAPGADPSQVRFGIGGAPMKVNSAGELELGTSGGKLVLRPPTAYQGNGGSKRPVAVRYVRKRNGQIGFRLEAYRRSEPLTIDPVLSYSTYLGGTGPDIAYGIAVDGSGDAYVAGVTGSLNFPVKLAAQKSETGQSNAFVAKLNPSGSGLIYSTYIGGSGADSANAIAIDSTGSAYIAGSTSSTNFPVTPGAFQSTLGGTMNAFVAKLSPTGSAILYATYLGGNATDLGQGIAVNAAGNAYVTGSTTSPNFPTMNALQIGNAQCSVVNMVETCSADAFVAEFDPTGTALVYSTYLGGSSADSGQAIAVDAQGEAVIAGYTSSSNFPNQNALQPASGGGIDAFVTKFDPSGSNLVFSTYLGGGGEDQAFGIALDASGNIYVTGGTHSADFPTTPAAFQGAGAYGGDGDAFLSKLSPSGNALLYSTFIGGSGLDQGNGVAADSAGDSVVVGVTQSTDFPLHDPLQSVLGLSGAGNCATSTSPTNVCSDAFIARLDASGTVSYSTYLGGTEADYAQAVAMDSSGTPYLAGSTASSNFPVIGGALQSSYAGAGSNGNAFIVKIDPTDAPGVALTPQEVNFGNQTLNVTSTAQTVTLVNAGSLPLQITSITASGAYAVSSNCGTAVSAAGGSCTISITFTPTTAGSSTDQITITDNAANSPQLIAVTGNGVNGGGAALTLSPKALVFPVQAIGTTSPPQVVQLINASQSAITLTGISVSGDYAETNNCGVQPNVVNAASVLNAGASCAVTVTFAPTASGSRTGSLSITDNAGSGSQAASLTGTGGGVFVLSASNHSSNIVVGTTSTTFTITASAASSFTSSISFACSSGATCSFNPATITAGQSTTMTVSGLSATTANPLIITVTGTAGTNTSTLSLSVYLQDFSLTATPNLNNITAGKTGTYSVTVTGINGFNGVVLLSVSSILPNETDAYWSPSSGVTVTPSSQASATLSLTTTTQQTTSRGWPRGRAPGPGNFGRGLRTLAMGLAALFVALLAANRKRLDFCLRSRYVAGVVATLLVTMGAIGCQNYGYNVIGTPTVVGTPTGTYVITIEGTLGTNSTVKRTFNVNLSVAPG
jgi:Abnormal spindle-like microcephaly-assoc'd, ASPM-SPD-2-Hydin/Beta-propeller repeat